MKKKWVVCLVSVVVVIFIALLSYVSYEPKGDTVESQQMILNKALPTGTNWTVYNAAYIDGYQLSTAYSSNGKSAIVVFEPKNDGGYKLISSMVGNNEEIIIFMTMINGKGYDLVWYNVAKTEYAEVTHTIDGVKQTPLRFDTFAMQLIIIPHPAKAYSWDVVYYDNQGKTYTR